MADVLTILRNGKLYYYWSDLDDDFVKEHPEHPDDLYFDDTEWTASFCQDYYIYNSSSKKLEKTSNIGNSPILVCVEYDVYYICDVDGKPFEPYEQFKHDKQKYTVKYLGKYPWCLDDNGETKVIKKIQESELQKLIDSYEKEYKAYIATHNNTAPVDSSKPNEEAKEDTKVEISEPSADVIDTSAPSLLQEVNPDTLAHSIFSELNIVDEEIYEVRIKNDSYTTGEQVDTNAIIRNIEAIDSTVTLMSATVNNTEDSSNIIPDTSTTIEAAVGIYKAVNEFGEFIMKGSECPVCGKQVPFIPSNGYCSIECALKAAAKKLNEYVTGEARTDTPEIIDKIKNVLNTFNLVLNVVVEFPSVVASFAKLPPDFRLYASAKLNLTFLTLKKVVNLLLIKKNELLIKLLSKVNKGFVDDQVAGAFDVVKSIIDLAEQLKEKLDLGIYIATQALTKINSETYIGPLEYGFFWTLKSNSALCTYYKTDPTVYPQELLGKPFWGSGALNIAFDMSLCLLDLRPGVKSVLLNVDYKKINDFIHKMFPPLKPEDYNMDVNLFKKRLAFSAENVPAIQAIIKKLETLMVIGGDFIPTYERLNLTNIWFIAAILSCWGPWTKSIYGDYIYHSFI